MIPATQRPDGSWRKARKIRPGFSSNSGGANRYVPPAFRAGAASSGPDPAGGRTTRSLGAVETGKTDSFLNAALFLLLKATPSHELLLPPSQAAGDTEPGGAAGEGRSPGESDSMDGANDRIAVVDQSKGQDCSSSSSSGDHDSNPADARKSAARHRRESCTYSYPPEVLLRFAARAAKEKLGCERCRNISPETGKKNDDDYDDSEWWMGLRQAEQAWGRNTREATAARGRGEESWVGLELSLRPSDITCAHGQAAVVDLLKSRVGDGEQVRTWAEEEDRIGEQRWCGETTPNETGLLQVEPNNSSNNNSNSNSNSNSGDDVPAAETKAECAPRTNGSRRSRSGPARDDRTGTDVHGEEAREEGNNGAEQDHQPGNSSSSSISSRSSSRSSSSSDAKKEAARDGDGDRAHEIRRRAETGEVAVVAIAVLVFSSSLSKRDRAELHGQAEAAGGVGSSSHGVGEARFLTLACGGVDGDRAARTELGLSANQANLARRLFRTAQDQYHSRYERLSHREIREVVAIGGPTAEDHPDLFLLLQKMDDHGAPSTSGGPMANDGAGAEDEMITTL